MDAIPTTRLLFGSLVLIASFASSLQAQPMMRPSRVAVVRSENFIVSCNDPGLAQQVLQAAEQQRRDLAVHWLGRELPKWRESCPISVVAGPRLGAGGSTTYSMSPGAIGGWRMEVKGSAERILDSVLPHEITHTILATHFSALGKPVPRWADEGACTTVEHESERSKHDHFLVQFLSQGRGLPFATMFTLEDYPPDIMPLYAQGYSVASFLIAQGGPRRFVQFLEDGMRSRNWVAATDKHYGYPKIGKLQTAWNQWVSDGGGTVEKHTALALGLASHSPSPNAAPFRGPNPIQLASNTSAATQLSNVPINQPSGESWYKQQLEQNKNLAQSPSSTFNGMVTPQSTLNSLGQPRITTIPADPPSIARGLEATTASKLEPDDLDIPAGPNRGQPNPGLPSTEPSQNQSPPPIQWSEGLTNSMVR
jgi:hypothetical protein